MHTPGLVDGALQDAGLIVLPIGPHAILGSVAPERRGELRGGGAVDRDKGAGKARRTPQNMAAIELHDRPLHQNHWIE